MGNSLRVAYGCMAGLALTSFCIAPGRGSVRDHATSAKAGVLHAPGAQAAAVLLFSIPYGEGTNQIRLVPEPVSPPGTLLEGDLPLTGGPSDFRVAWDGGKVYITDPMSSDVEGQPLVKVFSTQGNLVRTLASGGRPAGESTPTLDWMAVGTDGTVFLVQATSREKRFFEVFDAAGRYDANRSKVYSQAILDAESLQSPPLLFFRLFQTDSAGNLYTEWIGDEPKTVRIDPSGARALMPEGVVDRRDGSVVRAANTQIEQVVQTFLRGSETIATMDTPRFAKMKVTVFGDSGALRLYAMPREDLTPFEASQLFGDALEKVDGRGHVFVPVESRVMRWLDLAVTRDSRVSVLDGMTILEYSEQGARVGSRAQVRVPWYGGAGGVCRNSWDVDRSGNLYYLEFQVDRINVMMVPSSAGSPDPS